MKLTIEQMFSEMVEENETGGEWVNPKLEKISNPEFSENFMIQLDDFKGIHESVNVSIFSIKKFDGKIVIYCKQDDFR